MVYVIQFCWHLARKLSANLYVLYHCCVYSEKTPDDGQRKCLKHVEFYYKKKFEKLVQLVGFIIWIYQDARSSERQIYHTLIFMFIKLNLKFCLYLKYSYKSYGSFLRVH